MIFILSCFDVGDGFRCIGSLPDVNAPPSWLNIIIGPTFWKEPRSYKLDDSARKKFYLIFFREMVFNGSMGANILWVYAQYALIQKQTTPDELRLCFSSI